ncbi:SRPBCC domain-containing protein [Cytophagaceae bacterium DM2B3-1]|uniref:SRPBCC domain-containing protein n=1 Tax=Xanthocytophaga flava TaxID=3048013 RepID=A0ABT7CR30_9BACT|nr:SRPBCC domain-containing protein [Xanthocytophaga flavus]MDJ1468070.1 SRPBCC domain-containing protein [Xanthocytophaga flavus]MDJ1495966.1 SRPBCC domain-containing protein [Xanthocytophaga flavus]
MNQLIVENSICIDAPVAKVWNLLTNPEQTKKYMHGCEAISDWKVGSSLIWKGVFNGQELVAVTGHIVEIKPENVLSYTTFDPNNTKLEDKPENYLTVSYILHSEEDKTNLVVTQGDFAQVAEGESRYSDAINSGGWGPILQEIKKLAETE